MGEMNKRVFSIVVIAVVLLVVLGVGCITSNTKNNTIQNNITQTGTSPKNVSGAAESTVYPPDSSIPYSYGNVYLLTIMEPTIKLWRCLACPNIQLVTFVNIKALK